MRCRPNLFSLVTGLLGLAALYFALPRPLTVAALEAASPDAIGLAMLGLALIVVAAANSDGWDFGDGWEDGGGDGD